MPTLTALRYEAKVLGVPHRKLLFDLRQAGALIRDPDRRGHTVHPAWQRKFRARMFYRTITLEDGGSFQRLVSVVYCTTHGRHWLREFVDQQTAAKRVAIERITPCSA